MPSPGYPSASLYIGDLHPEVTESMLYEKFSCVGPIASIRLCKNLVTQRSLCYAYVNFLRHSSAERALDTLNYDMMKDQPMRIMWSQRDPTLRKTGLGNVFIKNLDPSIDNKAMYDTFSAFGNILSCKIVTDGNLVSKGYGYIHFETEEAARTAIEKVNGMLLSGRRVQVSFFMRRSERMKGQIVGFTNIYVKNFGTEMKQEEFESMFRKFGNIINSKIVCDDFGKTKGFGFVRFENHEAAVEAIQNMNGFEINGKHLYAGRALSKFERRMELQNQFESLRPSRIERSRGLNLYVKNLDDTFDDDGLREAFSSFGTITSAKVMMQNNKSRGFGFVSFTRVEEAILALTEMNGRMLRSKPLFVGMAQPKEERRVQLAAQRLSQQALVQSGAGFLPSSMPFPLRPKWHLAPMRLPPSSIRFSSNLRPSNTSPRDSSESINVNVPRKIINQQFLKPACNQTEEENFASMVAAASPQEQKQILGEKLFSVVNRFYPEWARKITGMILEVDNAELVHMLKYQELLQSKIEEAVEILKAHDFREN